MKKLVFIVLMIMLLFSNGICYGLDIKDDRFEKLTFIWSSFRVHLLGTQPMLRLVGTHKIGDKRVPGVHLSFISKSDSWRFLSVRSIAMLVDGKHYSFNAIHKGSVGRGYVLEHLFAKTSLDFLKVLAKAKKVEVQIFTEEFTLRDFEMSDLREFIAYFEQN